MANEIGRNTNNLGRHLQNGHCENDKLVGDWGRDQIAPCNSYKF